SGARGLGVRVNRKLAIVMLLTAALLAAAAPAGATPPKGSRAKPYPVHTTVRLPKGKGWTLRVNKSVPNGARMIPANKVNFPPRPGQQYFVINITMTYHGTGKDSALSAYDLSVLGPSGLTYTRLNDDCGVVPKALNDFKKVAAGRQITGNVCFSVRQ